jgi:hypothetical protein
MLAVSKLSWRAWRPLLPALVAGALVAVATGQRKDRPATPDLPPGDWDIPRLVAWLNRQGLGLRPVATSRGGSTRYSAFLTTADRAWDDLNRLPRDPKRAHVWRGTLYCERGPGGDAWADLARLWGDCCLTVGPFLLFGDRALLDRVRSALTGPLR